MMAEHPVYPLHALVPSAEWPCKNASFVLTLRASHEESTGAELRRVYVCPAPYWSTQLRRWIYVAVSVGGYIRSVLPDAVVGRWAIDTSTYACASDEHVGERIDTPVKVLAWRPYDASMCRHFGLRASGGLFDGDDTTASLPRFQAVLDAWRAQHAPTKKTDETDDDGGGGSVDECDQEDEDVLYDTDDTME